MGQGFQRKIDNIVDSIVSSEKENNKNIDEVDISESIKKAISDLNDVGKLLILDDLMIEAGSKPSTLLTLDGKISTERLNKVVISKVKEAEREGINLKNDTTTVFKENNKILEKNILTIAVINEMIDNFQDLTFEDIEVLIGNYRFLNSEQRDKYNKEMLIKIENSDLDEQMKKEFQDDIRDGFTACINSILGSLQKKYETNQINFADISNNEIAEIIDTLNISEEQKKELLKYNFLELLAARDDYEKAIHLNIELMKAKSENDYTRTMQELEKIEKSASYQIGAGIVEYFRKENQIQTKEQVQEFLSKGETINILGKEATEYFRKENARSKDGEFPVKQLQGNRVDILSEKSDEINLDFEEITELNVLPEQIKEALDQYRTYFENASSEDIGFLLEQLPENRENILKEELNLDTQTTEILGTIVELASSDSMLKLLGDESKRKEFFEQLDKQIELLEPEKEQEQAQEDIDMEAVKTELSAIPKALISIDASTQDIAEGMQGYKKIIENLDTKEIEGKSNDEVLKILAEKANEMGLNGNGNLILEMMTQIGFRGDKNSDMQIGAILTTAKDEFVQMIDDVSKEEYIENSRNEMIAKEPIKDREAEPGMKALMVDLQVGTKERNDLSSQIIGEEPKKDDIIGSSDTDATQGSTSSGKVSPLNIMNSVKKVRMSEIKNVQDLMAAIVKENNKEDKDKIGEQLEEQEVAG